MTQKLATLKNGNRPLDFGLSIRFHAALGMRAEGRADSARYIGPWFSNVNDTQVTISDVADDYEIPSSAPPPPTPAAGRALTRNEFLDVGMATDAVTMNAILKEMPVVAAYLDDYKSTNGIFFEDAAPPQGGGQPTRLNMLLTAAAQAGLIDQDTIEAFLAKWVQLYPAS